MAKEISNATVDIMASKGEEFSTRVLIKNDDVKVHNYILVLNSTPKGFQVGFTLNNKIIDKLILKSGENEVINLKIKVPQTAKAGSNNFSVEVKRDDGKISTMPLSITINNEYSLSIVNSVSGLSVINGQNLTFDVTVSNTGNKKLDNIGLKLDMPAKWMVKSTTPKTLVLKPNENGTFKVQIMVPSSQVTGNSNINLVATTTTGKINSTNVTIPVIVQSNPNFIYWIIGLIIISCIATVIYFRKHGRR
ncbi:MAG: NEW3 domain-containing protein [Clostridiaceae bacterium]|nr:NEW3 domain-containing protein [Clostridiaceae bacterium]